jgi:hypothetical protein
MRKLLYSYNVTILHMFRAVLCSSSGQNVCIQHMVSSLSMSGRGGRAVHGQSSAHFTARNTLSVRSLQSDRKRRRAIRKYASDTRLGKLRNIGANSCHKLKFQPSSEYCACRKQFIRVSCCRNAVNVRLYQKIPKTHARTLIPTTGTLNIYKSFCPNVPEVMLNRRTKS